MDITKSTRPVCMITGGSSGIGLATARKFAAMDYDIAICGRNADRLAEALEEISTLQQDDARQCLGSELDLSTPEAATEFAKHTLTNFGRVDVLVNNAATAPLAPFEEITSEVFESNINTNIRSVFYLTQAIWKQMKESNAGTIINISSLSAVDPFPGFSLYGASKSWLDLMTLALAAEGKESNIRVCSIRPGAVETPMLRGLFPDFPWEQCVQPADIAEVIWGCVNDPATYPSGQAFPVTNQT